MFYAAISYYLHRGPVGGHHRHCARDGRLATTCSPTSRTPNFHASFGHLEGYTSAYYTYMWSLVIAKDLFSAFDPSDLFDTAISYRYRDAILAAGAGPTPPTWWPTSWAAPTTSTPSDGGWPTSPARPRPAPGRAAPAGPARKRWAAGDRGEQAGQPGQREDLARGEHRGQHAAEQVWPRSGRPRPRR